MDSFYAMAVSLFATSAMLLVFHLAKVKRNIIKVIGTFINQQDKNSMTTGLIVFYLCGLVFGLAYWEFWAGLEEGGLTINLPLGFAFGAVGGLLHGFLASVVLALISTKHSLLPYKGMTSEDVMVNLAGHVVFGTVLGLFRGILA